MIPIETLSLFFIASLALGVAPGPDNIFVLTQSALHGRLAGLIVTLGLCTGLIVHTALVAFGVAAIFQTSAAAFNALKIVGAVYLLYLAWQAFRSGATKIGLEKEQQPALSSLYLRGVIMNITNPKVAIFFLAFLPQFADPDRGPVALQVLFFGFIFMLSTLIVFGTVAWTAGFLGSWLKRSDKAQIIMNRIAGAIFVGLAVKLLTTQR